MCSPSAVRILSVLLDEHVVVGWKDERRGDEVLKSIKTYLFNICHFLNT